MKPTSRPPFWMEVARFGALCVLFASGAMGPQPAPLEPPLTEAAPGLWMVDTADLSARLPPRPNTALTGPIPGQVTRASACIPYAAKYINGGCWIALRDALPPCIEGTFVLEGACFAPQMERPAQPNSVKK